MLPFPAEAGSCAGGSQTQHPIQRNHARRITTAYPILDYNFVKPRILERPQIPICASIAGSKRLGGAGMAGRNSADQRIGAGRAGEPGGEVGLKSA